MASRRNMQLSDDDFITKRDAKMFVAEKSIREKKPFVVDRSDTRRYEVVCPVKGCLFRISIRARKDDRFHVTKALHEHTCDSVAPTIKLSWLRSKAMGLLVRKPTITVQELSDWFRLSFGLEVSLPVLERCTRQAKDQILSDAASFGTIRSFLRAFESLNPGSKTDFEAADGEFRRAFLCPALCVRAFHSSTKVFGLDGCHIKARYGGVVLVAAVLDGNGNKPPAAFGIAESENQDTWSWFLVLLRDALHVENDGDGLVVISDREKGIKKAVKMYLPLAHHSYCVFHIQKNVKTKYKTSLNGLLFKAAKASNEIDFRAAINEMKELHTTAAEYVEKIKPYK